MAPTCLTRASYISVGTVHIDGAARFWLDNTGIEGVTVSLTGADSESTPTDSVGEYGFTGLLAGDYEVTPAKADGDRGITAYDASLVLQHAAGTHTLTGHAADAADVDSSGVISSMDASYILQSAVRLDLGALPRIEPRLGVHASQPLLFGPAGQPERPGLHRRAARRRVGQLDAVRAPLPDDQRTGDLAGRGHRA